MTSRPAICSIVPPHILREISRRGDARQRAWALRTMALSETVRARRAALGAGPAPAPLRAKRRTIHDAAGTWEVPGRIVRREGSPPTADAAVDEAYEGAGATWDLYHDAFERNSIDARGMSLEATVHFGSRYANAFWDGVRMVYGDGDGRLFRRFTAAIDVIGHELSHGVIQHEADLDYTGQPGALNESFADVFGVLVKQRALRQTVREADWLIGRGLFTRRVDGDALRSLKAPGTAYDDPVLGRDPQPDHMRRYSDSDFDNGGVHINSGIPNHAFYRAAMTIGGHAWEKAGRIWYVALRDRLRRGAGFARAAGVMVAVAGELYGRGSREEGAVREAWEAVGVAVEAAGERGLSAGRRRQGPLLRSSP